MVRVPAVTAKPPAPWGESVVSIRVHALPCLALSLALAAIAVSGCRKSQETMADAAIERASGGKVKVSRDGDRMTIKTEQGEMAVQGGEALPLPKSFPDDIYLPRGYRINSVMDMGEAQVLSLQASGKVSTLFDAAREAMDRQGWKQTMSMQNSTDTAMLAYEKDRRAVVLSFSSNRGEADVTMSVQLSTKAK